MDTITTSNPTLRARGAELNASMITERIAHSSSPVARYVDSTDVPHPPAPAWFVPSTSDIYIHVDRAGLGTLRDERPAPFEVSKARGLLAHEAAHAEISNGISEAMRRAPQHHVLLTTLEEVRVENYALRRLPGARHNLRASFTLVLNSLLGLDVTDTADISRTWTLVQGRTLAGIATMDESSAVDEAARVLLGDDTVDTLTDLLQEVVTLTLPDDTGRLLEICDEWAELVGQDDGCKGDDGCEGEPDGTGAKGTSGGSGDEAEGDDVGSGEGGTDETEAEADQSDETGGGGEVGDDGYDLGVRDSVTESVDVSPEAGEMVDAALKALTEHMESAWKDSVEVDDRAGAHEAAARVFGRRKQSAVLTEREPTMMHRRAVLDVSGALSNLALPAVAKVSKATTLPPGRLRSREAVRASAERAMGSMVSARPWRGTVRRHSTARPLILGIATDTSGSMSWAAQGVADFAYVYTNAGQRIGARTAAVTFGDRVYSIARPGEVLSTVRGKAARDGSEEADFALAALDGALHLSAPSPAARILIVVSDGYFVKEGETERCERWLKDFTKAGTHVLWVGSAAYPQGVRWVERIAKSEPNLTCILPTIDYDGTRTVFDALNEVALTAIRTHIR